MPAVGISITPRQMLAQWVAVPHAFLVGVHNFETVAGVDAVEVFRGSFQKQQFNTARSMPWPKLQGKYGERYNARRSGRILIDSGFLYSSIQVKKNTPPHKVVIHTEPGTFRRSKRNPGFCYAGVHNNLESLVVKPERGPKVERKFIGHSTILHNKLQQHSAYIFASFP